MRNPKHRENQREFLSRFIKNTGPKKCQRGTRGCPQACTARPPPQAAPWGLVGSPLAHWPPSFAILRASSGKKIKVELLRGFSAATRRNLSRTNLELRRDDPAGETSLPEGEIAAIVITNTPLIRGDSSPSTSSPAPSHLQTLVHHL